MACSASAISWSCWRLKTGSVAWTASAFAASAWILALKPTSPASFAASAARASSPYCSFVWT